MPRACQLPRVRPAGLAVVAMPVRLAELLVAAMPVRLVELLVAATLAVPAAARLEEVPLVVVPRPEPRPVRYRQRPVSLTSSAPAGSVPLPMGQLMRGERPPWREEASELSS